MEYSEIEGVGKKVSRLFFGTCTRDMKAGKNVNELLDSALALGVNAFDTARCYGNAEKSLGMWLSARNNREQVVIQAKGAINGFMWRSRIKESCIRSDLKKSLENMRTDYADIYLLHRDDRRVPVGTVMEILNALKSEGKVRAFGGSNWHCDRIEQANEYAYAHGLTPMTVSSPNFCLAEQIKDPWGGGLVTVTGSKNAHEREFYKRTGMALTAYSCLGNGLFSGRFSGSDYAAAKKSLNLQARIAFLCFSNLQRLRRAETLAAEKNMTPAQIAMAWLTTRGMNVYPIAGISSTAHLESCVAALDITLTEKESDWLNLDSDER